MKSKRLAMIMIVLSCVLSSCEEDVISLGDDFVIYKMEHRYFSRIGWDDASELDRFSKRLSFIIRRAQRPQWQGGSAACYWKITGKRLTQPMGPLRRREYDKLFENWSNSHAH